jgi:hypothetical protein
VAVGDFVSAGDTVTGRARTARRVACIGALKLYGLALAALLCDWMPK